MVGTGRGATAGVLIRNAEALETLEKVDTLVVDKTGTLTQGKPSVVTVVSEGIAETELLRLAGSLEQGSEHPLGAAIVAAARNRGITLGEAEGFQSTPGKGVEGRVDEHRVAAGNEKFLQRFGAAVLHLARRAEELRSQGQTAVFVAVDDRPAGLLGIADPVKPSTPQAIRDLQAEGLRIVMLTGDSRVTAETVARSLGIAEFQAEVLPDQSWTRFEPCNRKSAWSLWREME